MQVKKLVPHQPQASRHVTALKRYSLYTMKREKFQTFIVQDILHTKCFKSYKKFPI